jgi:Holliday junction resolvase RusA-like endonuclease
MRHAQIQIPGKIAGKGRPRATLRHGVIQTYTPAATVSAEERVRGAWRASGEPWLGDVPLSMDVILWEARPNGHWNTTGGLSAAGRRKPHPTHRPDLDNVAKLIADSLNGHLFRDDSQIAELRIQRKWLSVPAEQSYASVLVSCLEEDVAA